MIQKGWTWLWFALKVRGFAVIKKKKEKKENWGVGEGGKEGSKEGRKKESSYLSVRRRIK